MKKKVLEDTQEALSIIDKAEKLQKKAATVGFDWQNGDQIVNKIEEELNEVREVITNGKVQEDLSDEIGDLIFSCINLARYYQIDSENALKNTNNKFIKRFNYIEDALRKKNLSILDVDLKEMDKLWEESKNNTI